MTIDASTLTSALNGANSAKSVDPDAERDAFEAAADKARDERESRAAMATMAGRHPFSTVVANGINGETP